MLDSTGLTPKIYRYDVDTLTIEMELISGKDFTHVNPGEITVETARRFISQLDAFHRLHLYHGDMFNLEHYFLTDDNQIRLIDPIYMPTDNPRSGTTVDKQQATDRALAISTLKRLGVDPVVLE
ncbi:hypothetical protein KA012_01900 [Candidatus Woesebacteria bacterium]|nr:hypothetical protein [Candidatus Woesebacteria bacterium]